MYDIPGVSIANVANGTYFFASTMTTTTSKSGQVHLNITDGSNNTLFPLGSGNVETVTNADNTLQASFTGIITVSGGPLTIKLRGAAAGAVGNYSVGDRSLTLIKVT